MWVEPQQGVGNGGIQVGDESSEATHFLDIHVAWYQESTGYDQWRPLTLPCVSRCAGEVLQGAFVGHSGQRCMQAIVVCLQIELDATTRLQSQLHRFLQQPGLHGAIRLPTDPNPLVRQDLRRSQSMEHLGRGVTTEIADAERAPVRLRGKLLGRHPLVIM